jgi:glycosyltransferase involved in cell wall biosynthesis
MPNFAGEVMTARSVGQRVVTDLDDLVWDVPKGSLAERSWTAEQVLGFIQTLTVSDAVVTSTKWLSNRLMTEFKIPSVIVPNTIDVEHFKAVRHNWGTPYLGWAGTPVTRPGDLEILRDVLPHFHNKVKIQHSGHIEGLPTFEEKTGVKPHKVVDNVNPQEYPSSLDFHIGVIPLSLHDFNRAKSDIKGIEYAASGIPFVASSVPAYKQLQKDWGDVVRLARTTEEWVRHIDELRSFPVRNKEGEKLRKLAWRRDLPNAYKDLEHVLLG